MDTAKLREALHQASTDIDRYQEDNLKINRIVEDLVTWVTGAEYSSIWMNEYPLLIRERLDGVRELSMEEKRGLLYKCFLTQKAAFYNYITSEKGYVPEIDNPDSIRIKSKITIPLCIQDELLGIVTCYSSVKKIKNFSQEDLERFKAITPFVIDAIIRMQANRGRKVIQQRRSPENTDNGHRRRKRIIEKIEKIEEEKNQTSDPLEILDRTSAIVHDIRTPANNLTGFLEILEEQIEEKRLKEYIQHAKKSAQLITDLTTSILDTLSDSRIRETSRHERINLPRFFAEIGRIFSANMYEKRILYNIFVDPRLPKESTLEAMKLKRVLMNLIGNAVKFTPEGGTVEYSVLYNGAKEEMHISVKDTGIGIPSEVQEEIFKPYTQADDSTRVKYGGSGLGLSISAEFVREMGGELTLESRLEEGSTFSISLPLKDADAPAWLEPLEDPDLSLAILYDTERLVSARNLIRYFSAFGLDPRKIRPVKSLDAISNETTHLVLFECFLEQEVLTQADEEGISTLIVEENFLSLDPEDFPKSLLISDYEENGERLYDFIAPKKAPKILIVEDDRISVELIKTMLEEELCEIDVAYDGEEGLQMLETALMRDRPYDLLFSDHIMPKISGSEMIRRYREMEDAKDILGKLIAVSISGDSILDDKERSPYDFHVGKPFKKSEIVSILKESQNQTKE